MTSFFRIIVIILLFDYLRILHFDKFILTWEEFVVLVEWRLIILEIWFVQSSLTIPLRVILFKPFTILFFQILQLFQRFWSFIFGWFQSIRHFCLLIQVWFSLEMIWSSSHESMVACVSSVHHTIWLPDKATWIISRHIGIFRLAIHSSSTVVFNKIWMNFYWSSQISLHIYRVMIYSLSWHTFWHIYEFISCHISDNLSWRATMQNLWISFDCRKLNLGFF